jgi:hypothetical protein
VHQRSPMRLRGSDGRQTADGILVFSEIRPESSSNPLALHPVVVPDAATLALIPARVRFISYVPALGPLTDVGSPRPDWIICGG